MTTAETLGLCSLGNIFIAALQYLKGAMRNVKREFLEGYVVDRTGFKLQKSRFILVIMKKFFTVRLPSKVVDVPYWGEFKANKYNIFSLKPNFSDVHLNDKEEKA